MSESTVAAPPPLPPAAQRSYRWLAAPVFAFAFFALAAGFAAAHDPRSTGYFRLFFEDPVHLKAGFATGAAVLACVQLFTAGWMFRVYPWNKPDWINPVHRWSGRIAFILILPVAYHCIFKLGFQDPDARVLAHSLLGCAFFGGYAAKVTIVRLRRFPRPVLPIAGGLVFALLIGLWYTSSLWLYQEDRKAEAAPPPAVSPAAPPPPSASLERGRAVFVEAGCGSCHVLAAAGTTGQVGPSLDESQLNFAQIKRQVEEGSGVMPAFGDQLTPQQIDDVSAFVASSAGG